MHLLFSAFSAVASFSLIKAQQDAATVLPQCAQDCAIQGFSESTCTATNITCVCKDPTYAAVFDKCETANCTAAEQTVTNAYAVSVCAQVGGFGHNNTTVSSTAASISGTAAPTGTTTNGTFRGSPVPFTGGSEVVRVCGAVVFAGLLVGGMAVAL